MQGFAALPSTVMDATALAPLLWRQPKAASHNGGWEGRKTMHRTPTKNTHTRSGHVFHIFGTEVLIGYGYGTCVCQQQGAEPHCVLTIPIAAGKALLTASTHKLGLGLVQWSQVPKWCQHEEKLENNMFSFGLYDVHYFSHVS